MIDSYRFNQSPISEKFHNAVSFILFLYFTRNRTLRLSGDASSEYN